MTSLYPDLFPETLLVSRDGDRVFTTSLKVAEHFKRNHKDVLRAIRGVIDQSPNDVSRRNFAPRDYRDTRGKVQCLFELSHDGFAVLAMSFTGLEATRWKWQFLDAFRDMERQLQAQRERESKALFALRPRWQPIVAHPELDRQRLIGLTGHRSPGSITACRRRMREVGLLPND